MWVLKSPKHPSPNLSECVRIGTLLDKSYMFRRQIELERGKGVGKICGPPLITFTVPSRLLDLLVVLPLFPTGRLGPGFSGSSSGPGG